MDQGCIQGAIQAILRGRTPRALPGGGPAGYRHAGVLLPLLMEDGVCKVLFTRRTHQVEHHKGQISFPGGKVDEKDASIEETVLRETHEEIGLSPQDIDILGRIDDAITLASNYILHPLVGWVASLDNLVINRAEVEGIIKAPLSLFCRRGAGKVRFAVEYEGVTYETSAYVYGEHVIWGATARVMDNFMEITGQKICLPHGPG